jgi:phosphate transport system substrate-binding protein
MSMRSKISLLLFAVGALGACSPPQLSGTVRVDGSATVLPLSAAMAEGFHHIQPNVIISNEFSGTGGGFRKFCAGQTDINAASRPINAAETEQCKAQKIVFFELPVAFDSLSVVVNPKNTFVECLTTQELKAIWEPAAEGKVTSWRQVRSTFPDQPLTLFGPGKDSGTFDYFTLAVVGTESSSRGDYAKSEDDAVIERGVEGDSNALGYFGYAYYKANKDKLKLVAVNGGHGCVLPSAQSVADETYVPLSRPLFIYVNQAASQRPEVRDFIHFYLAFDSTQYVTKVGYVPLSKGTLSVQAARFDKGITGPSIGGHGSVLGLGLKWASVEDEDKERSRLAQ